MMTLNEMRKGYEGEVAYQKHMLKNLGYWFQLYSIVSGIGIVMIYFFHAKNLFLDVMGILLLAVGALGMLLFGYAGWRGQQNVKAVIDDYEKKVDYLEKNAAKAQKKAKKR